MSRRPHGPEAARGGSLGPVDFDAGAVIGLCPSCAAEIRTGHVTDPSGKTARAILHPMPFCTYFGQTEPEAIELAIKERKS